MEGGLEGTPLRFAITGASGLIGTALRLSLVASHHEVHPLVRRREAAGDGAIFWSPATGEIDTAGLEGMDAVVHLAGENLAGGRWTADRKRRIVQSRVDGTRMLAETLAVLEQKPRVLVSASGVSFYGDTGDREVDESSPRGTGFLAELCERWEGATAAASDAGIRVVHARMGPVLARDGGMLERLLTPFRFGVGGRLGSGHQYVSWIAIDDAVEALRWLGLREAMGGRVNVVAPHAVTNVELARTLAHVLHRPSLLAVPKVALELLFGEMANETVLAGQRVVPRRLEEAGFTWRFPELEGALTHVLQRAA